MNQKQIAAEQVQYTGNGTAGRQDMTAPTGFWIKHNDKAQGEHMTDTIGTANVTLVRDNEDGSSVYQFKFPPEALEALTRLGILTAIEAGIGEAKKLSPDYHE